MSWLNRFFNALGLNKTKIVIKLPPVYDAIIKAGVEANEAEKARKAGEASPAGVGPGAAQGLLDQHTAVDDIGDAVRKIVGGGIDAVSFRLLGPLAPLVTPAIKTLVDVALREVFDKIEDLFVAKMKLKTEPAAA